MKLSYVNGTPTHTHTYLTSIKAIHNDYGTGLQKMCITLDGTTERKQIAWLR